AGDLGAGGQGPEQKVAGTRSGAGAADTFVGFRLINGASDVDRARHGRWCLAAPGHKRDSRAAWVATVEFFQRLLHRSQIHKGAFQAVLFARQILGRATDIFSPANILYGMDGTAEASSLAACGDKGGPRPSAWRSDPCPLHLVMQLNDAVRKLLYTEQAERHLTMPRCKKGNTFPDEGWHDGDDELINRSLVQEGSDDLTSTHHPDVLASLLAEPFGKVTDRLGDEVDARGHGSRRRSPREHIVHGICTKARAHLQTPVEGLAAEDLGIGGARELRETVETPWSRPFRQPIEIAIRPSHVAVRARRDIDDDFSLWHHTPMSVFRLTRQQGASALE